MKKTVFFATIVLLLYGAGTAFADVTVVSVKGTVAYSMGQKWIPLEAGVKIQEGAKISTGVKSVVVLKLANSTVTVQPLSMMKIYEDKITPDSSDTRIALRRGALKAEVNRMHEVKTVFKVATPVATSSVRGTIQFVNTSPYGTNFTAPSGSIDVTSKKGQVRQISGNLEYKHQQTSKTPENIKREHGVTITDSYITSEEHHAQELVGDDNPDGIGGVSDFANRMMNSGDVQIGITWD
jgi:hypothetical protein